MEFKLNTLSSDAYKIESTGNPVRKQIQEFVADGVYGLLERQKNMLNPILKQRYNLLSDPYKTDMNANEIATYGIKYKNKVLEFACSTGYQQDYQEWNGLDKVDPRKFLSSSSTHKILSTIMTETITAVYRQVTSDILGNLATTVPLRPGQTLQLNMLSNEILQFEDSAYGAKNSAPRQPLYNEVVTINTSRKVAKLSIKVSQLFQNDMPIWDWYEPIFGGLIAKIFGIWNSHFVKLRENARYIPASRRLNQFSTTGFGFLGNLTASLNRVRREAVSVYGGFGALQAVLPQTMAPGLIYPEMNGAVAPEWFRNGYVRTVSGMNLFEIENVTEPNTDEFLIDDDFLLFIANGGRPPITIGIPEMSPVTTIMQADETADEQIEIAADADIGMAIAPNGAICLIENVVLV